MEQVVYLITNGGSFGAAVYITEYRCNAPGYRDEDGKGLVFACLGQGKPTRKRVSIYHA
jgi:hypothetical protein